MKKILGITLLAALAFTACRKKTGNVSVLHNYSTPTIMLPDGMYYSMPVNGMLPIVQATAYDSFYHEDAAVVFDQSKLDITTPGVYPVTATAKNSYGMGASKTIYIAVTDVDATVNLEGRYLRVVTDDTLYVTRLANGLYYTSDAAANGISDTTHVIPAMFVQTSATTLVMPVQDSKFGPVYATNGTVDYVAPDDVTISYVLQNNAFAPVIREFRKI